MTGVRRPGGRTSGKAYRVRAGEEVEHALHRIARHELESMEEALAEHPWAPDCVHEVRKATKRLRALVRLGRDALGERCYRRENAAYRDIGRLFSIARDATVLSDGAGRLERDWGRTLPSTVRRIASRTLRRQAHATGRTFTREPRVRRARQAIRRALARVDGWTAPGGWSALDAGLRRIYQRARGACRQAQTDASVATLHEWRKRAKDLRYAVEMLEAVWPTEMRAAAKDLNELTDLLGDDHDLAVLMESLLREPEALAPDAVDRVSEVVGGRRQRLQSSARTSAARIFQERPRQFTRRMGGYWHVWRRQTA